MPFGNGNWVDLTIAAVRPRRGQRVRRATGVLLMTIGAAVFVLASAFLGYASYTNWQLSHVVAVVAAAPVTEVAALTPTEVQARSAQAAVPQPKPLLPANRIVIGSIELDAKVVELGTHEERGQLVWDTAAHAVGWYRTTALPGQGGNIVMSGHISSPLRGEGSIFRRLPEVKIGDTVLLETPDGQYRYAVFSREIVPPTAVGVMSPTPSETLTLITCYPDLVYSHRLVVQAWPVEG